MLSKIKASGAGSGAHQEQPAIVGKDVEETKG